MTSAKPIKIKALIVAVTLLLFGAGCSPEAPRPAVKTATPAIADERLKNMGYPINGFPGLNAVTFKSGRTELDAGGFVRLGDIIGRGDLNGDGFEDAVVVLYLNFGGSGTWPVVYAVMNDNGTPRPISKREVALGDRDQVDSISIANGIVSFGLTVHGDKDPMCCPTEKKNTSYRLDNGFFSPIHGPLDPTLPLTNLSP